MVTRSVIAIDLDDAAFTKFKSAFDEFGQEVDRVRANARRIGGDLGSASAAWREMASHTRSVAGSIASATRNLLKWTGITTAVGGLLGAGGLWGIDRLAISAGNQRRQALGLGATPGEIRGFGATYGRVIDPSAFLGGVNAALTDVTKRVGLYGAGLSDGDIRGKDTGQVAAELLPALKRLADQTPTSLLAQVLSARHLDQFIGLEDFQRLKNTPLAEINSYQQQYQARRRDLELTAQQQRAWQDLQVQLHFAGLSIEQTFIRGLTPMAPQLGRLSEAFTGLVKTFLGSDTIKTWIDDVAIGMKDLAAHIGTPEFKTNVESFVSGVGHMAAKIAWFLGLFDNSGKPTIVLPGGAGGDKPGIPGSPERDGPRAAGSLQWLWNWLGWGGGGSTVPTQTAPDGQRVPVPPNGVPRTGPLFGSQSPIKHSAFRPGDTSRITEAHDFFRAAGWTEAQTAGLLANLGAESGFNPGAVNASGHRGIAQWDSRRWAAARAYFGHDPNYEEQLAWVQIELSTSEKAAADQLRRAGTAGDAADVVNRGYERSGVGSGARAGAATQYMQSFRTWGGANVTIQNQTGGNANVSVAQLATT